MCLTHGQRDTQFAFRDRVRPGLGWGIHDLVLPLRTSPGAVLIESARAIVLTPAQTVLAIQPIWLRMAAYWAQQGGHDEQTTRQGREDAALVHEAFRLASEALEAGLRCGSERVA